MSVKHTVKYLLLTIVGLLGLYFGVCCVATMMHAIHQVHLESATLRLYFMGYTMMAAANGLGFLACAVVCVLLLLRKKPAPVADEIKDDVPALQE